MTTITQLPIYEAMGPPYVWPYYYPHEKPHPCFHPPLTAPSSGYTHWPSMSVGGSPYGFSTVILMPLPVHLTAPPLVTPVEQPAQLHPDYTGTHSHGHWFLPAYAQVETTVPAPALWEKVPATYYPTLQVAHLGPPLPQLHYLLSGNTIHEHLYANFAVADLTIKKRTGPGTYEITTLSSYDLEQPATIPPMKRISIVCDRIPQWPVDLRVIGTTLSSHCSWRVALPYLTLEDIVHSVHASLHRQISQEDWDYLSTSQQMDIKHAYTHRIHLSGSEWAQQRQRAEGIKRVDFLLRNTWLKGFTWLEPENGVERLKLLLGPEP